MATSTANSTGFIPRRATIGIVGGMGPAATVDFMAKVVAATPAHCDQEHIPSIVHNVPQIPDRSAAIERCSDEPFLPLLSAVRMLDQAGADYIAIPCNTAHYWYDRLVLSCRATIIHIADAVAAHAQTVGAAGTLALMATRGTIKAGIYQPRLSAAGLNWLVPDEPVQQLVDQVIHAVKGGEIATAQAVAHEVAFRLLAQGADRLILACTEIPIAMVGSPYDGQCIDATDVLARACVVASLGTSDIFQTNETQGSAHVAICQN